jgi:hypothetical protein
MLEDVPVSTLHPHSKIGLPRRIPAVFHFYYFQNLLP